MARTVAINLWWELFDANVDCTKPGQSYAEQLARSIHGKQPQLSLTALMILCRDLWEASFQ